MDLNRFMQQYAAETRGQYTEYDDSKSIVIVPVPGGRYQTVIGQKFSNEPGGKVKIEFSSRVCEFSPGLDLRMLLEENQYSDYSRFIIQEGFVKVVSTNFIDLVTDDEVRGMVEEVAYLADEYERKLTGKDIH
jgi:hypothetical protein